MSSVIDLPLQGTIGASLKPVRYDIEIYQGDTFRFSMTLKNGSTAIDVTGWTALAQIKKSEDEGTSTAETPALEVTVGTTDGKITVFLTATETSALTGVSDYKYDIQLTDLSANKRTFIGGKISVMEDISE